MIKIHTKVPVDVDGSIFNLTVRDVFPDEKKILEQIAKEQKEHIEEEKVKERKKTKNEIALQEAEDTLAVNKKILGLIDPKGRLSLLVEIKKLGIEVGKLKLERLDLEDPNYTKANDALERIYKEKFNFVVGGEEKEALKKMASEHNISFQRIWEEIDDGITEQNKKKLPASEDGQSK